jgi:hypothetical protein
MLQLKLASTSSLLSAGAGGGENNNVQSRQIPLEVDNLPLSLEQPDVFRNGLDMSVTKQITDNLILNNSGVNYAEKKRQMLRNVASQYGLGAAIRRQADLMVVEQFHR